MLFLFVSQSRMDEPALPVPYPPLELPRWSDGVRQIRELRSLACKEDRHLRPGTYLS